jgi:heptosyltransferase-2
MRALVIQTAFIGDVVLTTPVLAAIARQWPGASVDVVTTPEGAEILAGLDGVRAVALDKRRDGFREGLRKVLAALGGARYDVVLAVHRSPRSLLIGRRVAADRRVCFASIWARLLGYETVPYPQYSEAVHYADKPMRLLEVLGGEPGPTPRPRLAVDPRAVVTAREKLGTFSDTRYAVLSPFSVWGTKMWFADRFARVGAEIAKRHELGIVVIGTGTSREAVIGETIVEKISAAGGRAASLVGQTSIAELKAVIRGASLVVANDSAPVHIAAAFDIPTVAIFGPTTKKWGFFPLATNHEVVERKELPCRPCHIHGPKRCPLGHFKCMDEIQVDDVARAVDNVIRCQLKK